MAEKRVRVVPDNGTECKRKNNPRLGASVDGLSTVAGRHSRLQQRVDLDEWFNVFEKRNQEKKLNYYFQIHL